MMLFHNSTKRNSTDKMLRLLSACVIISTITVFCFCPSPLLGQDIGSYTGITESIKDVTLSLPVSGRVSKIFFNEGDRVRKGQLLVALDNTMEKLEVNRRKLLWESKVEVDSAARKEKTLKSFLDATRSLFESTGSVSREDLEKKELEYLLSVAEREHLEIIEQREKLEYELAVENFAKRSLISPGQGTIIKFFVKEGEGYDPNQVLVNLVDTRKCLFICNIDEQVGRTLKKGRIIDLQIKAGDSVIAKKGKIIFSSPVVDPASGLLEIKAVFDNLDGQIRPGVSGYMLIPDPQKDT